MATTIVTFKTAAGTEVEVDVVGKRLRATNPAWVSQMEFGWEPFEEIIGELGLRPVGFSKLRGRADHFWTFKEFVGVRTEPELHPFLDTAEKRALFDRWCETEGGTRSAPEAWAEQAMAQRLVERQLYGRALDDLTAPLEEYEPPHIYRMSPEAFDEFLETIDVVGPYVSDLKVREAAEAAEGIFAYRQERSAINDADRIEEMFHAGLGQAILEELDDDFVEPAVGECPDIPELALAIGDGKARLCFVLATVDFDDFMAEA